MSESTTSTSAAAACLWPALKLRDADRFLRFMVDTVGFEASVVYRDGERVQHGELLWPAGGGLMFASASDADDAAHPPGTGGSSVYLVHDDPDGLHSRVAAAGATILLAPYDTPYGSREFAFADAEGNRWSVGTYGGQPRS